MMKWFFGLLLTSAVVQLSTVFCNWGGHRGTSGGAIVEVSPDKKVVWQSSTGKANRISSFQLLD